VSRKFGLTIDNLISADVVLANGAMVHASAQENNDLLWAIRGGGGNLGVATRFRFRLHEVDQVLGGLLVLPAMPDVISSFVAAADAAPDELSTIANVMTAPPMPFLPAEYHGKLITLAMLVYAGEIEAGQRVIAPFRAIAKPIADMIRPMRYPEIYQPEEAGYHPVGVTRTMFVDGVDRHAAETMVEHLRASTAMMAVTQIRVLGGAMARVPSDATAFAHRGRKVMINLAALYNRPDEAAVHEEWVTGYKAALDRGKPGAYVNFLSDEGEARVREAYPGKTWDRLAAIKARYDPTNLFHMNHNVRPAVHRSG
jgi:FAD/FMN-containing dehydrogenase